ncbi:hypothetical protein PanWU01x14_299070 [Parasponia andersonii]|uniref:Uncharacterized protein n=1 Tax=Parasponia andersonii TaxID=3476 RepID=A0A2P5AUM0_PARAD|nr:hypothetical protein PanWU01x14_299070 [Parasponia andersonii]
MIPDEELFDIPEVPIAEDLEEEESSKCPQSESKGRKLLKQIQQSAVATPSSSKKMAPAKKSATAATSATVATDSSSPPQAPISADLEALKKDQDKHNERLCQVPLFRPLLQ